MAKYHINRNTHEVGVCRAEKTACPVSDYNDHFDSETEATLARERKLTKLYPETFTGVKKTPAEMNTLDRLAKKGELVAFAHPDGDGKLTPGYVVRISRKKAQDFAIVASNDYAALVAVPLTEVKARAKNKGAFRHINPETGGVYQSNPLEIDMSDFDEVDYELIDKATVSSARPYSYDPVDERGVTREENVTIWKEWRALQGFKD